MRVLADPIAARRFLLSGIALFGAGILNTINATTKLFVANALDYPLLTMANATSGLIAATCLTLAFWPNHLASSNSESAELSQN